MSAKHAGLFGLLQPGFNALRVGMQVDKRVFSAISSVHETTMTSTAHADLALQSGDAVGATPSDLVAILEALREAGALNAELIVI